MRSKQNQEREWKMDKIMAAEMPMPAEGTAAADALAANAAKPVTRFNKLYKRSKRKPPIKTNTEEDDETKIVPGRLITRENDMYVMSIGMMLGLRVSLMYNASNVDEDIVADDMHAGDHYVFPPEGNNKPNYPSTPKHHLSHTFKFKDYAPKVFHRLRLLQGVDTKSYMDSVSGNVNYVQFTSNSKSGQFFFFTPDGDYMIKTVTHEEVKELLNIMPDYYNYLKTQPDSFLCRVTGMYRVQMYHLQRTVYFIVMASAYKGAKGPMDTQYDCKGSHVGRTADPGDSVRKDNDLLDDGFRLLLGKNREPVLSQIRRDVAFLRDLGFLDYSILIGAKNVKLADMDSSQNSLTSTLSKSNKATQNHNSSTNSMTSNGSSNSLTSNDMEVTTAFNSEDEEEEETEEKEEVVTLSKQSSKSSKFRVMRFMNSGSSRATSSESGIDDNAAAAMAASMLKLPIQETGGGAGGHVDGGDSNGTRMSVELIADKIVGKSSNQLSPSSLGQPLGPLEERSVVQTKGRKSSTMTTAAAAAATRKKMSRRVSSRTIQFEYTKKWEAGIVKPVSLNEERELALEIRNRLSTVSMINLNENDGLRASQVPHDAPWLIPQKMNESFEQFLSKEDSGQGTDGKRSLSVHGTSNKNGGADEGEFVFASPLRGNAAPLSKANTDGGGGGGVKFADGVDSTSEINQQPVVEEYRLGVIDFLTKYGINKMAERNFKSFKYEKKALSVAPPDEYAARLIAFMEGVTIGDAPPLESPCGGYLIEITLKEASAISCIELVNSSDVTKVGGKEEQWKRASRGTVLGQDGSLRTSAVSNMGDGANKDNALKGSIISSVRDGSEPWKCGVRIGDRIHRINGELIPQALNCKQVSDRLKRASRPVYITLERLPTVKKSNVSTTVPAVPAIVAPDGTDTNSRKVDIKQEDVLPPVPPVEVNTIVSQELSESQTKEQPVIAPVAVTSATEAIASSSADAAVTSALDSVQSIILQTHQQR